MPYCSSSTPNYLTISSTKNPNFKTKKRVSQYLKSIKLSCLNLYIYSEKKHKKSNGTSIKIRHSQRRLSSSYLLSEKVLSHWDTCTLAYPTAPRVFLLNQRYAEITHDHLLFSVAQGIFWPSTERLSRSTLHLKEGEERSLYRTLVLCSLVTVLSCIDPSVRIVTKFPKGVGPLLIFSISLFWTKKFDQWTQTTMGKEIVHKKIAVHPEIHAAFSLHRQEFHYPCSYAVPESKVLSRELNPALKWG